MGLFTETLIVSLTIMISSAIPFFWKQTHKKNSLIFLVGTGALTGIVLFDLLPDLWQLGGAKSLWLLGAVWLVYSIAHVFHIGTHHHHDLPPHTEDTSVAHIQESSILFILSSMMAHCFASGVLLAVAAQVSMGLAQNVFYALLAHKVYEALTVSSVVVEKVKSRVKVALALLGYSLSLPVGVLVSFLFRKDLSPNIAILATSLAAGTLLGCLVFDFWMPTLAHLKHSKKDLVWLMIGLLMTQVFMLLL